MSASLPASPSPRPSTVAVFPVPPSPPGAAGRTGTLGHLALCLATGALMACGGGPSASSTGTSDSSAGSTTPAPSPAPTPAPTPLAGYFVSPTGDDTQAGTEAAPWKTIAHAQAVASPGDTIYFRGGTYAYTSGTSACTSQTARISGIDLSKSGSSGLLIQYLAYPGETPVFDFSGMKDDCRIKGFNVTASYVKLQGLEITGVPQNNSLNNESWGVWISGSHNVFEQLNTHHHMGPGLFIQGGGDNLVLNTDSHHNYDPYSKSGAGQNADGFGVHITAANVGNVLRGCRSWMNSDDGFDLINAYAPVVIENSWAWMQGYIPGTTTPAAQGNGNGFKLGGYGGEYDANAVAHTVRFSVAFSNRAAGFYMNHHPVANYVYDNTAFSNKVNFNMLGIDVAGNAVGLGVMRNNVAYGSTAIAYLSGTDTAYNSWDLGLTLVDTDFQSVSTDGWDAARQSDGSLPVLTSLRPSATGALIDRGVSIGATYTGAAPDLGAFEYGVTMTTASDPSRSASRLKAGFSNAP